jgi:hypothetical protein
MPASALPHTQGSLNIVFLIAHRKLKDSLYRFNGASVQQLALEFGLLFMHVSGGGRGKVMR